MGHFLQPEAGGEGMGFGIFLLSHDNIFLTKSTRIPPMQEKESFCDRQTTLLPKQKNVLKYT